MAKIGWKPKQESENEMESLKKENESLKEKIATLEEQNKGISTDLQGFMDFYFSGGA